MAAENLLRLSYLANDSIGAVFASFAPYLIVTLFMSFAAVQVLKTGAAGASAVTGLAMKLGGAIKNRGKQAGLALQRRARNYGRKVAEGKSFLGGKIGTLSRIATGGATKDDVKKHPTASKWARRLPFLAGPMGGTALLRHFGAKLTEEEIKESEKRRKKIAGKSIETKKAALKNAVFPSTKADIAAQVTLDGDANDVPNMPQGDELKKLLESAIKTNAATANALKLLDPKETKRAVDSLVSTGQATEGMLRSAGVFFDKEKDAQYGDLEGKLIAKMKVGKMESMYEDTIERYVDKDGLGHKFWTGAHIAKGADLFGRTFVETFIKGMKKVKDDGGYEKIGNARLGTWARNTAAKNHGIDYENLIIPSEVETPETSQNQEIAKLEKQYNDLKEDMARAVAFGNQTQIDAVEKQQSDIQQKINEIKQKTAQQEEEAKRTAEEEKRKREATTSPQEPTSPLSSKQAKETAIPTEKKERPLSWKESRQARKEEKKKKP